MAELIVGLPAEGQACVTLRESVECGYGDLVQRLTELGAKVAKIE